MFKWKENSCVFIQCSIEVGNGGPPQTGPLYTLNSITSVPWVYTWEPLQQNFMVKYVTSSVAL